MYTFCSCDIRYPGISTRRFGSPTSIADANIKGEASDRRSDRPNVETAVSSKTSHIYFYIYNI